MLLYIAKRIVYTLPIMLGVAFVCFLLVHMAPGDPLVSVLPPDASESLKQQVMVLYGFDRPYHEQFLRWLGRAVQGDLGTSIRTSRPVIAASRSSRARRSASSGNRAAASRRPRAC